MAEVYRRGKKRYLGIDFDPDDYEQLRSIAQEDGDRGVSSLVRSIVHSWLRSRQNAPGTGLPTLPPVMTFPQAPTRASIMFAPPEFVTAEESPSNEATDTPSERE
jgi:hypothetical protein